MDANALIDRNRALVALAQDTCRWSREVAVTARTMRDQAAQGIGQTNVTWRLAATRAGTPASPRYVQSLRAEAAEIQARVRALVAAAKRSPPSETPD